MLGNCPEINDGYCNPYGKDNFVFFEAEGKGHFVGCNLTIICPVANEGFPEGDDMFFIDGDKLPTINGCGHECFFNRAFGLDPHPWLHSGSIIGHERIPDMEAAYRFCVTDPVYFNKSIKFTMEHGHGNIYAEDWCATSYWYQTLPGKEITIQPLEERLPNLPMRKFPDMPELKLTAEQKKRLETYNKRFADWLQRHKEFDERRYVHTREASRLNIEQAKKQRERFMNG